jgi:hypothetical protein
VRLSLLSRLRECLVFVRASPFEVNSPPSGPSTL